MTTNTTKTTKTTNNKAIGETTNTTNYKQASQKPYNRTKAAKDKSYYEHLKRAFLTFWQSRFFMTALQKIQHQTERTAK